MPGIECDEVEGMSSNHFKRKTYLQCTSARMTCSANAVACLPRRVVQQCLFYRPTKSSVDSKTTYSLLKDSFEHVCRYVTGRNHKCWLKDSYLAFAFERGKTPFPPTFMKGISQTRQVFGECLRMRKPPIPLACWPILPNQACSHSPHDSYRRWVQHDANGRTERLWWEVVAELCSYDAGVACTLLDPHSIKPTAMS